MKKAIIIFGLTVSILSNVFAQTDLDIVKANYHIHFYDEFDYGATGLSGATGLLTAVSASSAPDVTVNGKHFYQVWELNPGHFVDGAFLPHNVTQPSPGILRLYEDIAPLPTFFPPDITHHTIGGMSSKDYFSYGIIEARLKFPDCHNTVWQKNAAAAFWTNPGPTEIDIIDNGMFNNVPHAVWDWSYGPEYNKYISNSAPFPLTTSTSITDFTASFHDYACVWTPSKVSFYIDGMYAGEINYTDVRTYGRGFVTLNISIMTYFKDEYNLSDGGKSLDVDWVKVYRQNCDNDLF
ncbi:MAG: laminarinase, partial [Flavipsychrobacter sp.]|nr:laminarinase [Flavipsychrobacter sp.]